jgi:hypothetical protein
MVEINYDAFFRCLAVDGRFRDEVFDEVPFMDRVTNVHLMMAFEAPSQFTRNNGAQAALKAVLSPEQLHTFSQRAHGLLSSPQANDPFAGLDASTGVARLFRERAEPAYNEEEIPIALHADAAKLPENRSVAMNARVDKRKTVLAGADFYKDKDDGTTVFHSGRDTVVLFRHDSVDWNEFNSPFLADTSLRARELFDNRLPSGALLKAILLGEIFPGGEWDRVTMLTDLRVSGRDEFDPEESFAGYRIRGLEGRGWRGISVALEPEKLAGFANLPGISAGKEIAPEQASALISEIRKLHYALRSRGAIYDPTYISVREGEIVPGPGGLMGLLDASMFFDGVDYIRGSHMPHGADPYDPQAPFVPNIAARSAAYKEMNDGLTAVIYGIGGLSHAESRRLEDLPLELKFGELVKALGMEELSSQMRAVCKGRGQHDLLALAAFNDYLFQYIDRRLQLTAGIEVPDMDHPDVLHEMIRVLDADLSRDVMPMVVSLNEKASAAYDKGRAHLREFIDDPETRRDVGNLLLKYRELQGGRQRTMFLETIGTEQFGMFGSVGLTLTAYLSGGDYDAFADMTSLLMERYFDSNADILTWSGFVDVMDPKSGMQGTMTWYNPLRDFIQSGRVNFRAPVRMAAATRIHHRSQPLRAQGLLLK